MRRTLSLALVAAVLVTTLAAAPAGAQTTTTTSPDARKLDSVVHLRIGSQPFLNWAPLFVAQAKGYFKAEKLDVELVNSGTGAESQSLLATGRLDVGLVGLSAGFFNGIASGLEVTIIGGGGESVKGSPLTAFVVPKGSSITKVADLRGKKVGVAGGMSALTGWYVAELLKQGGLTPDDVQPVALGQADGLAALNNGALAATALTAPLLTQQLATGAYRLLGDMDKVLQPGSGAGVLIGPNLAKKNRRAATALLRALYRASRTDLQGDFRKKPAIVQILSEATKLPTWVIKQGPPQTFDPDLDFKPALVEGMQKFFRTQRFLNYAPNIKTARLLDTPLVAAARSSLR